MKKSISLSMAASLALAATAHASDQEGWRFDLAPYLWAPNVEGDLKVGNQKFDVDNDLWENLDNGFMGQGTISYNRFVFYLDYDWLSLSDDFNAKNGVLVPVGTDVDVDLDVNIVTGGIGYRFDTWGSNSWVDVLVGARNLTLDRDIDIGIADRKHEEDVTDAMFILRPSFAISENWRFNGLFGVGIGGDSESTYELMPQFQYNFSEMFSVRFGYKSVYYDIESGDKGATNYRNFDGSFNGPFIGLGWTFPSKEKPAPIAAAPVAPPPEKCTDVDNDGVCDDKDACPNTPPGKRVGPNGCDCDFTLTTHFAFNSAELTAEDKAQLDKLVDVISNPALAFVSGVIEGHTDSLGSDAYNNKLSYRRAESVRSYLQSKGVSMNNAIINGKGESEPIADNKTEEGRAQNRRVVIRRTDCGPAR